MSVVHIYRIPQVIDLTFGHGGVLMNYTVNRTDFKLSHHVDNQIDIWVKNIDRKAVTMANATVSLNIIDPHINRIVMTRDLEVVDAPKGLLKLFVAGEEAAALPIGAMNYSVIVTNTVTNQQTLLYTDRERRGLGVVEIVQGPIPDPPEPYRMSFSDFIQRDGKYYSENLVGAAGVDNYSGQHSIVVTFANFSGKFTIQGSLQENPSSLDSNWFNISTQEFVNQTSLTHIPFEGNILWARFVIELFDGTIERIEYRN